MVNRESLFQMCQPISYSLARRLLYRSFKYPSAFGCWDPVKVRADIQQIFNEYENKSLKQHKNSIKLSLLICSVVCRRRFDPASAGPFQRHLSCHPTPIHLLFCIKGDTQHFHPQPNQISSSTTAQPFLSHQTGYHWPTQSRQNHRSVITSVF